MHVCAAREIPFVIQYPSCKRGFVHANQIRHESPRHRAFSTEGLWEILTYLDKVDVFTVGVVSNGCDAKVSHGHFLSGEVPPSKWGVE